MAMNTASVTPETLITIKVSLNDSVKKLKLPLKDLNSTTLPSKLRTCLNINRESVTVFERYSDSVGGYVILNENDVPVYKSLVRAAKAKGKLRMRCNVLPALQEQDQGIPQPLSLEEQDYVIRQMEKMETPAVPQQASMIDNRNLGSGIFQFRDARASQQTLVDYDDDVPVTVPGPFTASMSDETRQATLKACQELAFRAREPVKINPNTHHYTAWSVYCNICDNAMADAHYHCSICDGGDYDLCEDCVSAGKTCPGEDHWLIKRFIKDGKVVTSTTERVLRKTPEVEAKVPGAFLPEISPVKPLIKTEDDIPESTALKVLASPKELEYTRTCNNCVSILPERNFVTCQTCNDFDLCIPCHSKNEHGHHPGHAFDKATADTWLTPASASFLEPGRNLEHNAFCDGCDKKITGIRHKCLQCPDWDYCNDCISTAPSAHPRHRFAALYEQLPEPQSNFIRHFGIYCDGPLCSKKTHQTHIKGVRYKCAICHDTDFCAQCEALPGNQHNRTHPLIKFATPVKNVNITTINEDTCGQVRNMGDKQPEPVKTEPINAPIPVQTVADIAPSEEKAPVVQQRTAQPIDGDIPSARSSPVPASMLNAEFVKDTIRDGTEMLPGERFTQVWTLRNVGPFVWPAGCSVRYVGGDNMLNVDNRRPNSVSSITKAIESSIVARDVQVGEEIAFSIMLKAPMRSGKSISYWRLKAADGTPFGHRLWCDIDVRNQMKPASMPAPMPAAPAIIGPSLSTPDVPPVARACRRTRDIAQRVQTAHDAARRAAQSVARINHSRSAAEETQAAMARLASLRARILETRADRFAAPSTFMAPPPFMPTLPQQLTYPHDFSGIPQNSNSTFSRGLVNIPVTSPAPVASASVAEMQPETPIAVKEEEPEAPVAVKKEESEDATESTSSSQMIFPKLEKESPASSMIASSKGKAAYIENEAGEVEGTALPQSPVSQPEATVDEPVAAEIFDDEVDILSVSKDIEDDYSEDDGFLTDEEYDILDASDRETVHSP